MLGRLVPVVVKRLQHCQVIGRGSSVRAGDVIFRQSLHCASRGMLYSGGMIREPWVRPYSWLEL